MTGFFVWTHPLVVFVFSRLNPLLSAFILMFLNLKQESSESYRKQEVLGIFKREGYKNSQWVSRKSAEVTEKQT